MTLRRGRDAFGLLLAVPLEALELTNGHFKVSAQADLGTLDV